MNCFFCKGQVQDKQTTFMVDIDDAIVIIKNVPSQVCSQCGEVSYSNEISQQLEKMIDSIKSNINEYTEITVVNFRKIVAKLMHLPQ